MVNHLPPSSSIALATYNGEQFLQPLLNSLASQTWAPCALIVSDDGSTDQTLKILSDFAKTSPFPVILENNPGKRGILNNFYHAFAMLHADVIFYCDQDDVWHPQKLALIMPEFADPEVQAVIHRSRIVNADLVDTGIIAHAHMRRCVFVSPADCLSIHGFGHQMALRKSVITVMNKLQTRAVATPSIYANNFDRFIPFCATLLGKVVLRPEPLVDFRRHGGAATEAGKPYAPRTDWQARAEWLAKAHGDSARLCAMVSAGHEMTAIRRIGRAHHLSQRIYNHMAAIACAQTRWQAITAFARVLSAIMKGGRRFSNQRLLRDIGLSAFIVAKRLQGVR
jgi:glycosyltransferase involved in cell wall biosynthesis